MKLQHNTHRLEWICEECEGRSEESWDAGDTAKYPSEHGSQERSCTGERCDSSFAKSRHWACQHLSQADEQRHDAANENITWNTVNKSIN